MRLCGSEIGHYDFPGCDVDIIQSIIPARSAVTGSLGPAPLYRRQSCRNVWHRSLLFPMVSNFLIPCHPSLTLCGPD